MKITSLARFAEKVAFYSPQILTISSCIGIISGTVMACEATVKAKEVLDNRQETDYLRYGNRSCQMLWASNDRNKYKYCWNI